MGHDSILADFQHIVKYLSVNDEQRFLKVSKNLLLRCMLERRVLKSRQYF